MRAGSAHRTTSISARPHPPASTHRTHLRSANQYKKCIEDAEKAHLKATGKAGARAKSLKALEAHAREMARAGQLTAEDVEAINARLTASRASLAAVSEIQPLTGSIFVRLFLGQVNVREASSVDRAKLREEYEKFRFRTSFGFIVFPLIWIFNYVFLRHTWRCAWRARAHGAAAVAAPPCITRSRSPHTLRPQTRTGFTF